jgi:hypothetical protein
MNSRPEPAGCPAVSREDVTHPLPVLRVAVRGSSRSSHSMPPRPPVQARGRSVRQPGLNAATVLPPGPPFTRYSPRGMEP